MNGPPLNLHSVHGLAVNEGIIAFTDLDNRALEPGYLCYINVAIAPKSKGSPVTRENHANLICHYFTPPTILRIASRWFLATADGVGTAS